MPHIRHLLIAVLAILVASLFGIVLAGQLLGFMGVYTTSLAILITLGFSIIAGILFYRSALAWHTQITQSIKALSWFDHLLIVSAIGFMIIICIQRFIRWPESLLGFNLPSDLTAYHAIKALELVRSGSFWNLAIPYGQYPIGYESLLAFVYTVTGSLASIGSLHAIITLLIWVTMTLLIIRYSPLADSIALWLALLICLSPPLYSSLLIVGKNDTLITATILVAILFAPIGRNESHIHLYGLAFITLISLATKLTGLYVLVFLWLWVLWVWWGKYRQGIATDWMTIPQFGLALLMMFPCGLWVIRNYIVMGELLTSEIRSFFQTSIFANIANPLLYQSGAESQQLFVVTLLFIGITVVAVRLLGRVGALLFGAIAIGFAVTPLSAFHTQDSVILHIEWRYALYGICFAGVMLIVALHQWIDNAYSWITQHQMMRVIVGIMIAISFPALHITMGESLYGSTTMQSHLFSTECSQPIANVYEFVRCEIESGVIYSEGVNWFLLTYPNPQLHIHSGQLYPLGRPDIYQMPAPDYAVTIVNPTFESLAMTYSWELLYSDGASNVFRRIP